MLVNVPLPPFSLRTSTTLDYVDGGHSANKALLNLWERTISRGKNINLLTGANGRCCNNRLHEFNGQIYIHKLDVELKAFEASRCLPDDVLSRGRGGDGGQTVGMNSHLHSSWSRSVSQSTHLVSPIPDCPHTRASSISGVPHMVQPNLRVPHILASKGAPQEVKPPQENM